MSPTKTVLVMDDSEIILETVKAVLEAHGFAVLTASNLRELEAHCEAARPDLFVLDVQMPEIFGDDVAQVLRNVRRTSALILLFSSVDEPELAERARDAGVEGHVSKSAGVGALLQRVVALLGSDAP